MQTLYHAKITGDYAKHNSCILRFKKIFFKYKDKIKSETLHTEMQSGSCENGQKIVRLLFAASVYDLCSTGT